LRTSDIVRASLSSLYVWAMAQGFVSANPLIGTLRRHAQKSRERVLSPAELRAIWSNLADDHFGSIIKLLMLSGQRAGEISGLRWSEVDFNTNTILLPGSRTKNGHSHVVSLSGPMRNILAAQPRRITADGKVRDLIFGIGEGPFSGWSNSKAKLDSRIAAVTGQPLPEWRVHDARRSWATHAAELGVRSDVIELALNHRSGRSGIIGVYNKSELMPERRTAFDRFGEWLMAVIEGRESNIVTLPQTA
jgi:integrase